MELTNELAPLIPNLHFKIARLVILSDQILRHKCFFLIYSIWHSLGSQHCLKIQASGMSTELYAVGVARQRET